MTPDRFPPSPGAHLDGYAWVRDDVGASGASVHRLHGKAGAPDLFLKHAAGEGAGSLADEMVRLRWLVAHVPVPEVVHFVHARDEAWLLTTALEGETAYEAMVSRPGTQGAIVDALADFMRRLHAIPVAGCPFDSGHAYRMTLARRNIDAGLVDADDFDDERTGWTAEQVWDALQAQHPVAFDRVVTHGDFSLDNLIVRGDAVVGCIDVGRAGVADRYQDLAILWNNLGEFDEALQARLFTAYGIAQLDEARLRFHLLLDELF